MPCPHRRDQGGNGRIIATIAELLLVIACHQKTAGRIDMIVCW